MWPLCSCPSGSCYFMAPFTQGMAVPLSQLYISLSATVSPPVFLTRSVSVPFSLTVADYHFLFFSVTEESHSFCISLSQPLSLSSFSLCFFSIFFCLVSSFSHFYHFPCYSRFSAFLPHCSIVALVVPLLIHHLLLSTDLFAKNKPLQLRDRKKCQAHWNLWWLRRQTDKRKLQSSELKNPSAGGKTKKSCQKLP